MLDSRHAVATPEGVDLTLVPAGVVARATAFVIDLLLRGLLLALAALGIGLLGHVGIGLFLLLFFAVEWFYPVLFEVLGNGATPGKRSVGLRVVEVDGRPVGLAASMIRNLLRTADFLPLLFGAGLVAMLLSPRFQRLGDMAAGTLVVWAPAPPAAGALPEAPALAPAHALRLAEQQALIAFAERCPRLSPARQVELAELLEPLTGARGRTAVTRLQGMARWLAGER